MKLRDLFRSTPTEPPPRPPFRRARGTLIVPKSEATYPGGEIGKPSAWSGNLNPPPVESPTWPFERWLIESFAANFTYVVVAATEAGEKSVVVSLTMKVAGEVRWTASVTRQFPAKSPLPTIITGSIYSNLAAPIEVQGGELIQFSAGVEPPAGIVAPQILQVDPFRIPYSVDHGGG